MKTRIIQLTVKAAGYIGVPMTTAQSEWLVGALLGIAALLADLWLHRKQPPTA